jgi:hypothetical protein
MGNFGLFDIKEVKLVKKDARKEALAKQDKVKRTYTRKVPLLHPLQLQSIINDLEVFIAELPSMKATEYLEKRELLIKTILRKGNEK